MAVLRVTITVDEEVNEHGDLPSIDKLKTMYETVTADNDFFAVFTYEWINAATIGYVHG